MGVRPRSSNLGRITKGNGWPDFRACLPTSLSNKKLLSGDSTQWGAAQSEILEQREFSGLGCFHGRSYDFRFIGFSVH
jgi:hypothetical protein